MPSGHLLLVLPLRLYRDTAGAFWIDSQACNGLRLWLTHFARISLVLPLITHEPPPKSTSPIADIPGFDRVRLVPMPAAYTPLPFAKNLPAASRRLASLIDEADHLHFAIGGLWGDWGAVAGLIAHRRNRRFAVWTDRVESEVARFQAGTRSSWRRLYYRIVAWAMGHFERAVIRRAAIGMFHGAETYAAYASLNRNPHLVHDIHVGPEIGATPTDLLARRQRPATAPLMLVYAGRPHPDKGVADWINALERLAGAGISFQANWYGDGPQRAWAEAEVDRLGLSDRIHFPGLVENRDALFRALGAADIFLFCHKTPESPRCLIEALRLGLPLVGYDSAYPRDLIALHGGGILTPIHQPEALAAALSTLAADRDRLHHLVDAALADGEPFNDVAVFAHRAELMRTIAG